MSRSVANRIAHAKRIVVKVGSSILIDQQSGRADETWLNAFAGDVARVRGRGQSVLVVSSGAVALGAAGWASSAGRSACKRSRPRQPPAKVC